MEAFWKFVDDNAEKNPAELRLKYHGKKEEAFDLDRAILQIECRRRFGKKLAETMSECPRFLFPDALVGEQSTSDALAKEHVGIALNGLTADGRQLRGIDLTAGLGIDAIHLAKAGVEMMAVEMNVDRSEVLRQNAREAGLTDEQLSVVCADSLDYIIQLPDHSFDIAFIDPARRDSDGARVYALADCQPDVVAILPQLKRIARRLVVKMSPMLDVSQVAAELGSPALIAALGTTTECKELVAVVDFETPQSEMSLKAITIGCPSIEFTAAREQDASATFGVPAVGDILYEPYPAVMKMGPFKLLSLRFHLAELHPNSHLYFSIRPDSPDTPSILAESAVASAIPAQAYEVEAVLPWRSSEIKRFARRWPKISVATRNFPMPADVLRRKLGTREGDGSLMLFATTLTGGAQTLIVARTIKLIVKN